MDKKTIEKNSGILETKVMKRFYSMANRGLLVDQFWRIPNHIKLNIQLLAIYVVLILFPTMAKSQYVYSRTPEDTIPLGKYHAVYYQITEADGYQEYEYEIYLGDKKLVTSPRWGHLVRIYNKCQMDDTCNSDCCLDDINNDGKPEIIFWYPCGGSSPSEDYFIYSLDSVATEIGKFNELRQSGLLIEDIDGDNTKELVMCDLNFQCWYIPNSGSPCPRLVWKWDGHKYRLANFKLANYLIKQKGPKDNPNIKEDIKWWVDNFYGRPGYDPYPYDVWFVMLEYIYAGKYSKADSAFETLWPQEVQGKDKFYKEFWNQVKSSYYWPALLKSDW